MSILAKKFLPHWSTARVHDRLEVSGIANSVEGLHKIHIDRSAI